MNIRRVLFLCNHNSARSQMAEAFLKKAVGNRYEVYSAGLQPAERINPYVVKALTEVGVDVSGQYPKSIEEFEGVNFDYVVTVCDEAQEVCPFFPGRYVIHKGFPDPASFEGDEEEVLEKVRIVRDEIKDWIENHLLPLLDSTEYMG